VAEDLTLVDLGWPLLERVDRDHGPTEQASTDLSVQAGEYVAAYGRPVQAWKPTVRADRVPTLGQWRLGDSAVFDHTGDRWLGDGQQTCRILAASGDHTDTVALTVVDAAT
jgi:hypothetical protein